MSVLLGVFADEIEEMDRVSTGALINRARKVEESKLSHKRYRNQSPVDSLAKSAFFSPSMATIAEQPSKIAAFDLRELKEICDRQFITPGKATNHPKLSKQTLARLSQSKFSVC